MLFTTGLKSINPNIWREPNPNPAIYRESNFDYEDFTLIEVFIDSEKGVIKPSLDKEIMVRADSRLALANFPYTREFVVLKKIFILQKNNEL